MYNYENQSNSLLYNMALENLKTEEKSNWGGPREGSGRKPRLQYEARELFNAEIDKDWLYMATLLRYHIRKGDKELLKWVIEQRIGKAPQSLDIEARGAFLSVPEEITTKSEIDIMTIAEGVSKELKRLKTK